MQGWIADQNYPGIKQGVFELIAHPLSCEDEDPDQGKILVGCAQCKDFYKKKRPASVDVRSFAWADGAGCQGRKVQKLLQHLESKWHLQSSTKLLHEAKKADMPTFIDEAHQDKRNTMELLFRTIYYIAKTNRPLSDYLPLRNLQVRNGLEEMDLSPLSDSKGTLNQASANYSSEHFVGEALESLAAVCRVKLGKDIRKDKKILLALLADASQTVAVQEVLLLYLRWLLDGKPQDTFLGAVRMELKDEEELEEFAALLEPPVVLKKSTPSVQGDYRLKGGVNQARLIIKYLTSDRCRQVFQMDSRTRHYNTWDWMAHLPTCPKE